MLNAHVVDVSVDFGFEHNLHVRFQLRSQSSNSPNTHLVLDLLEPDGFAVLRLHHLRLLGFITRLVFDEEDGLQAAEAID